MKSKVVQVWLKDINTPIVHQAISTYIKGWLFCVLDTSHIVTKYPQDTIFRVVEPYDESEE